jgi:hypothetical protein
VSVKRKGPKSAGPALTTARMAELAETIADPAYVLGPQDEADLVEALRELLERRRTEQFVTQVSYPPQPEEAAA